MIGQITPLVKVAGRLDWMAAAGGFVAASTLSAAFLGFVLGTIGKLGSGLGSGSQLYLLGGLVFLACALAEAGLGRPWMPSPRRQTPKWFKDAFGSTWGAVAWGLDLGQGWTTRIEFAGYFGMVAWALLLRSPLAGALVAALYGLGRGLPVLVDGVIPGRGDRQQAASPYLRRTPALHAINAVALAAVGGYMIMM